MNSNCFFRFFLFFLFTGLIGCIVDVDSSEKKNHTINYETFFCNAEKSSNGVFSNDQGNFKNVKTLSSEFSFSGSNSSKVNSNNPYGFLYEFNDIKKGEIIHSTVWRKKNSSINDENNVGSIIISDNEAIQYQKSTIVINQKDDWEQIECTFKAINNFNVVKVYVYNLSEKPAYFDDLSITKVSNLPPPPIDELTLRLFIPSNERAELEGYIAKGKKERVLRKSYKKYVKGYIIEQGDSIPIKLRLKGDWTDHLKSDKFSLRIKTKKGHSFRGLSSFSIQDPNTRSFMREWYIHKLCDSEDVLTTSYKFLNVEINGELKGVYAMEEHFDKQLVESRNRREGPIVRLDETGYWQVNIDLAEPKKRIQSPSFESSSLTPFKKNRTYKNETLRSNFLLAQNLLYRYKNRLPNPENHFDIERFAKYLAILDVGNIFHSQIWHNQRQYYNPVTCKLEPVVYDCFQGLDHQDKNRTISLLIDSQKKQRPTNFNLNLLNSKEFRDFYYKYVSLYSSPNFLSEFNLSVEEEMKEYKKLLSYEYPFYNFDSDFFKNNASEMAELKDSLKKFLADFNGLEFEKDVWEPFPEGSNIFRPNIALKAHTQSLNEHSKDIDLRNFHLGEIEVYGYSTDSLPNEIKRLTKSIHFNSFSYEIITKSISIPANAKYLHYYPKNLNGKSIRATISKWPFPNSEGPLGDYLVIEPEDDGNVYLKGNLSYEKNVVIKKGAKVIIAPGTSINLKNNAGFISYIPLEALGTASDSIRVFSSDHSSGGFNVLASEGKSNFDFVDFNHMNAMQSNNWILTGAVTINGHGVEFMNCTFRNNHCEDGLNIIRSDFLVKNCTIENTFADGFDADFCTGLLTESKVTLAGNDAIDFSGSDIKITNCEILNAGDKGISGGEKSVLTVSDTHINGAVMAVASKDLSKVSIENSVIENCEYGYAVFRKKPEYGPASITSKSVDQKNIITQMLLDKDSDLNLNGKTYTGKEYLDIEALYAAFN